jgi:hypothetical protein
MKRRSSENKQDDHLKMPYGNLQRGIGNFLTQVPDRVHVKAYVWI